MGMIGTAPVSILPILHANTICLLAGILRIETPRLCSLLIEETLGATGSEDDKAWMGHVGFPYSPLARCQNRRGQCLMSYILSEYESSAIVAYCWVAGAAALIHNSRYLYQT